jgi:sodium-dependent dicarboxylate transporter 2/3/5
MVRESPLEPYDAPNRFRARWWVLPLVVLGAVAGALVAPDPWPAGAGSAELRYREASVLQFDVELGSLEAVEARAETGNLVFLARFPEGVPIDARIRVELEVRRDGLPIRPQLGDLELHLIRPDGVRERIPVVRWDDATRTLIAQRRPPQDSAPILALLGAVVVLWVSELVPLFVTSLAIPVVLAISGVGSASESLAPFFHPIIALFFGGFLMAEAMRRTRLDHFAAIGLVARFGRSPATLFASMLGLAAFLSMWMSNTAATAVLIPIARAITAPFQGGGYQRAMVLGIAYAATIGGVGSAIGTPANPLAIEFLADFAGRDTSFVGWFSFGLPMVVLFLPLMGIYLWWRMRPQVDAARFAAARRVADQELQAAGPLSRDQLTVLLVFAGVVTAWLTQTWHGVDTGIIALAGALALFGVGRLEPGDLGRISWPSLLTFGGGLALGLFLVETGTADWIATRFDALAGAPPFLALLAVAALSLGLTTVASNTAAAAMLIPLAIPLAGVLGLDPVLLVVTIAVASSVDFALVIGTPPTMLAYATGLFTAPQILRIGFVLDLVGILLLVTAVRGLWGLFGVA